MVDIYRSLPFNRETAERYTKIAPAVIFHYILAQTAHALPSEAGKERCLNWEHPELVFVPISRTIAKIEFPYSKEVVEDSLYFLRKVGDIIVMRTGKKGTTFCAVAPKSPAWWHEYHKNPLKAALMKSRGIVRHKETERKKALMFYPKLIFMQEYSDLGATIIDHVLFSQTGKYEDNMHSSRDSWIEITPPKLRKMFPWTNRAAYHYILQRLIPDGIMEAHPTDKGLFSINFAHPKIIKIYNLKNDTENNNLNGGNKTIDYKGVKVMKRKPQNFRLKCQVKKSENRQAKSENRQALHIYKKIETKIETKKTTESTGKFFCQKIIQSIFKNFLYFSEIKKRKVKIFLRTKNLEKYKILKNFYLANYIFKKILKNKKINITSLRIIIKKFLNPHEVFYFPSITEENSRVGESIYTHASFLYLDEFEILKDLGILITEQQWVLCAILDTFPAPAVVKIWEAAKKITRKESEFPDDPVFFWDTLAFLLLSSLKYRSSKLGLIWERGNPTEAFIPVSFNNTLVNVPVPDYGRFVKVGINLTHKALTVDFIRDLMLAFQNSRKAKK